MAEDKPVVVTVNYQVKEARTYIIDDRHDSTKAWWNRRRPRRRPKNEKE